jgi:hypothetical protein
MACLSEDRRPIPAGWFRMEMETANDYRKFADECRSLAKRLANREHKAILEQMAEAWLRLAGQAEHQSPRAASKDVGD